MKNYGINLPEGTQITNLSVETGSSFPSTPNLGQLFVKTAGSPPNLLYHYDGSTWVDISSAEVGDISSITAGSGLTGGGSSGAVTLDVGAGTGITVNADSIQTNDAQIVHNSLSGYEANRHIDHTAVTLTAGSGLTGGGDISANRTVTVGAGDGITVNADDVAVNSTVLRTTGAQSKSGILTMTASGENIRLASDSAYLSFYNTAQSTRTGYLQYVAGSSAYLIAETNIPFEFRTNNTARLVLTADGNANFSGQGRFSGWYASGAGEAAEIGTSSNQAHVLGYNRTDSNYIPLNLAGTTMTLTAVTASKALALGSTLTWNGDLVWTAGNDGSGSGLDADLLDGLNAVEAATGSTIVRRHSSGYIFATYYNQSSGNDENPTISQFYVDNGSDGYHRKASLAHAATSVINNRGIYNSTISTYGNHYIQGTAGGYVGLGLNDGALYPTFMSNGSTAGIYMQAVNWLIYYQSSMVTTPFDFTANSDIRLKENVQVIPNALSKVLDLSGYTYTKKNADGTIQGARTGVIAQEVEKVLPEAVGEDIDGYKTVAYGNMVGLLIEAIKEQQKQIDELRALVKLR